MIRAGYLSLTALNHSLPWGDASIEGQKKMLSLFLCCCFFFLKQTRCYFCGEWGQFFCDNFIRKYCIREAGSIRPTLLEHWSIECTHRIYSQRGMIIKALTSLTVKETFNLTHLTCATMSWTRHCQTHDIDFFPHSNAPMQTACTHALRSNVNSRDFTRLSVFHPKNRSEILPVPSFSPIFSVLTLSALCLFAKVCFVIPSWRRRMFKKSAFCEPLFIVSVPRDVSHRGGPRHSSKGWPRWGGELSCFEVQVTFVPAHTYVFTHTHSPLLLPTTSKYPQHFDILSLLGHSTASLFQFQFVSPWLVCWG